MRKSVWILQSLIMVGSYIVFVREPKLVQEMKLEAGTMVITSSPEGNNTFLSKTTWCMARPEAPLKDLQSALDWACGPGYADCVPIQDGGSCFEPQTLLSHVSNAFNDSYQQNGKNDVACNFGGTAIVTKNDPSYGKCIYAASGDVKFPATPPMLSMLWWEITSMYNIILYGGNG